MNLKKQLDILDKNIRNFLVAYDDDLEIHTHKLQALLDCQHTLIKSAMYLPYVRAYLEETGVVYEGEGN